MRTVDFQGTIVINLLRGGTVRGFPPIAQTARDGWGTQLFAGSTRSPGSAADEPVDLLAVGVEERHRQRHLAEGVGGAAQARIEGADYGFDAVRARPR